MAFVHYVEGLEHKAVCIWINCLSGFDRRESKRQWFCSYYCERAYEANTKEAGETEAND